MLLFHEKIMYSYHFSIEPWHLEVVFSLPEDTVQKNKHDKFIKRINQIIKGLKLCKNQQANITRDTTISSIKSLESLLKS